MDFEETTNDKRENINWGKKSIGRKFVNKNGEIVRMIMNWGKTAEDYFIKRVESQFEPRN